MFAPASPVSEGSGPRIRGFVGDGFPVPMAYILFVDAGEEYCLSRKTDLRFTHIPQKPEDRIKKFLHKETLTNPSGAGKI